MKLRPSAIARIVACPGSLRMSDGAPSWIDEYGDSTVREEGNACHWVAHQNSQGIYPALGQLAPNGVAVTEEMHIGAQMYLNAVARVGCSDVRYEQHVQIPSVHANCSGTPDAAGVGIGTNGRPFIFIGDLKFGYRIVNVWPNYQLITYAAGIAGLMGWDLAQCDVHLMIAQPRRWHRDGLVRSWIGSGLDVLQQVSMIGNAAQEAFSPAPRLTPGDHCDYCPGRARCSAVDKGAIAFSFDTANDLTTEQAENELSYLLQRKELLDARISGLSAQVDHAIRNGERVAHFERVRTTARPVWTEDGAHKVRALGKMMGLPLEKEPDLITPTQARKLLPAYVVDSYAHRPQGAFKLERHDPNYWVDRFKQGK